MSVCYVVATPIGNLGDLSPRAQSVLQEVDLIAAEDTRHSGRLLAHFGIETPQVACHEFSAQARIDELVQRCCDGEKLALITDAGTPAISDPGYVLVRALHQRGCPVIPVPGPSALVAALSVSGLPCQPFRFHGFAPAKGAARRQFFSQLMREPGTQVIFEAPHRVVDALRLVSAEDAQREVCVAREISKRFEQYELDTAQALCQRIGGDSLPARGEFVLVIAGAQAQADSGQLDVEAVERELAGALPASEAAAMLARLTGLKRRDCYARIQAHRD